VDPLNEIEALVAHRGRAPGTDAERRAARHLEARLREMGRDASVEPIDVWPRWPLTHVVHAVAAVVGSVLTVGSPLAGAIVLLVVAVSVFGDLTGLFQPLRRATGRRASQNVVSREDGDRAGTLVLVAHYDAGRTGFVFDRLRRLRVGPFQPFFWALLVALACAIVQRAGLEGVAVTAVQYVATIVLIVSVPLLADVALSRVVPGANDNASGVACVLELAERYGDDLDHFDLWVLLTGAEEGMELGMRAFLRAHRRDLPRDRTAFVCVDEVGHGTVRWARREGYVLGQRHNRALVELCERIADEDEASDGRYGARTYASRTASDAYRARAAGYPAVRVSCRGARDRAAHHHLASDTVENIDPEAIERAFGFCSELIELIDEELGPELG
jgi:Peptidase family M28